MCQIEMRHDIINKTVMNRRMMNNQISKFLWKTVVLEDFQGCEEKKCSLGLTVMINEEEENDT